MKAPKPPGIEACGRCGSARLRLTGVGDGVILGQGQDLSLRACLECDHVGVPFLFDDEAARAAFARGQRQVP